MSTVSTAVLREPWPHPRHPTRWALGLSALVHGLILMCLPWASLLQTLEEPQRWLEVQIQTTPIVPPAQPEPVPAAPVVQPKNAEPPPEQQTSAPDIQSTPAPPTAPASPEVITSAPGDNSPDTWEWRDTLLRQSRVLAPPATATPSDEERLPENWTQPILPDTSSWLDPYSIPGDLKQETWTDTDGIVRMEVTLPNGQRVCGRATPADPLQPLSFSIPLWTTCGKVRGREQPNTGNPFRRPKPKPKPLPER